MAWYTDRKADHRREREQRWRQAGDNAFQAREFEDALSWYQRIINAYPNSIEGWNSTASALKELDRYGEAADAYETTANLMKQDTPLLTEAAECAWQAGQEDRAVELAVLVAENDPGALRRGLANPSVQGLREHPRVRKALDDEPNGTGTFYA